VLARVSRGRGGAGEGGPGLPDAVVHCAGLGRFAFLDEMAPHEVTA
jgi:hypothetical protein